MTDYNESTQKKFWMFSREQFDQIRQDSHDRIVKLVIQNNYRKEQAAKVEEHSKSESTPNEHVSTPPRKKDQSNLPEEAVVDIPITEETINKYLTVDEEWALLTHYLSNVFDIYPNYYNAIDYRSVQYSVCSYVKRFFMKRSILQYNPKLICAGAYMLALKVDEYPPINAKILADLFGEDKDAIISAEQKILFGNNYEVIIHPPQRIFKILDNFMNVLSKREKWKPNLTSEVKKEISSKVDQFLIQIYTTELEFFFPPSSITLFAYSSILNEYDFGQDLFKDILLEASHFDMQTTLPSDEEIMANAQKNIELVKEEYTTIDKKIKSFNLKSLNRKWRKCREYDTGSSKHRHAPQSVAESTQSSQTVQTDTSLPPRSEKRPHSQE